MSEDFDGYEERRPTGTLAKESIEARAEQLCGAPISMGWKSPDKCPKCRSLKNTRRRCVSCDKWIIPGCRSMFTCRRCYYARGEE